MAKEKASIEERKAKGLELVKGGMPITKAADEVSIAYSTLKKACEAEGIKLPGRGKTKTASTSKKPKQIPVWEKEISKDTPAWELFKLNDDLNAACAVQEQELKDAIEKLKADSIKTSAAIVEKQKELKPLLTSAAKKILSQPNSK